MSKSQKEASIAPEIGVIIACAVLLAVDCFGLNPLMTFIESHYSNQVRAPVKPQPARNVSPPKAEPP